MPLSTPSLIPGSASVVRTRPGLYSSAPNHVTRTATALTADLAYYTQFELDRTTPISHLGAESTVGGTTGCTLIAGIYANTPNEDVPGALIVQTSAMGSTGATLIDTAVSAVLPPGSYWGAVLCHSTATVNTMRVTNTAVETIAQSSSNVAGTNPRMTLTQSGLAGALPDPAVPNNVTTTSPLIMFRRST